MTTNKKSETDSCKKITQPPVRFPKLTVHRNAQQQLDAKKASKSLDFGKLDTILAGIQDGGNRVLGTQSVTHRACSTDTESITSTQTPDIVTWTVSTEKAAYD